MADQFRSTPNQQALNYTSTGLAGLSLGFNASYLAVYNDGGGAQFYDFRTSAGATTGDPCHKLSSGESLVVQNLGVGTFAVSVAATSTAGVGRILALG